MGFRTGGTAQDKHTKARQTGGNLTARERLLEKKRLRLEKKAARTDAAITKQPPRTPAPPPPKSHIVFTLRVPPDRAAYFTLVKRFPLERIRNDHHLDRALSVIERLLKRETKDQGVNQYLSALTDLIEAYESKAFPISDASEGDVLRELMRLQDLSQTRLAELTGIKQPTISDVLGGKRGLTKDQVVTLANFFHVSPDVFLKGT
ncbi:helix-turn-helix domain-containing protein [Aquisphaera insulae]|uniref:helix-turn-helix domain-containing protein n=1 Tax=Aquisphaera insulae TaxID=2712864 RepID=UPI0013EC4821|nr:helix-turn-helix domain-containing protein [Aquisphaera insulae]